MRLFLFFTARAFVCFRRHHLPVRIQMQTTRRCNMNILCVQIYAAAKKLAWVYFTLAGMLLWCDSVVQSVSWRFWCCFTFFFWVRNKALVWMIPEQFVKNQYSKHGNAINKHAAMLGRESYGVNICWVSNVLLRKALFISQRQNGCVMFFSASASFYYLQQIGINWNVIVCKRTVEINVIRPYLCIASLLPSKYRLDALRGK